MICWKVKKYNKENISRDCTKDNVNLPDDFVKRCVLARMDVLRMSLRMGGDIKDYLEELEFSNENIQGVVYAPYISVIKTVVV